MLNILKILFCTPFLIFSCYSDIKTRRVKNKVWLIMLAGGVIFELYEIWMYGFQYIYRILVSTTAIFIFVYIIFQLGIFGGADAKSLIVLSFIFPTYPEFSAFGYYFPINGPLSVFRDFFSFDVFENAVLLTIVVPLSLAIYNVLKMGMHIDKPLYAFIGYKVSLSEISNKKHVKLIEDFETVNGKVRFFFKRGGVEINDEVINDLNKIAEKGMIRDIWITPGLPFMIPITLGFFLSVFYGNLIMELTKYILLK